MKQFCRHINYLIQKHDCVIIPEFGGFVLHRNSAKINADGSIHAPSVSVGFNPDLKSNDGLLAESYMNAYSISYDIACKRLGDVVQRINTVLSLRQSLQIGTLGKLYLDDSGLLSFEPNTEFSKSYSETFGLENLGMKRLSDLRNVIEENNLRKRKAIFQKIYLTTGAVAAAIAVFFISSTPIKDTNFYEIQKSGFFVDVLGITKESASNKPDFHKENILSDRFSRLLDGSRADTEVILNVDEESTTDNLKNTDADALKKESSIAKTENKIAEPKPKVTPPVVEDPSFYVIIGSAPTKSEANRLLSKFRSEGYKTANIVEARDRSRVYVKAFTDKLSAEKFLADFRQKNPSLADSWIFTKHN